MTESAPPPLVENSSNAPTSLAGMNMFATPADVFDEIRFSKPSVANWMVPLLLSSIVGVIYIFVVFSQPAVQQQLREKQEQQLAKLVADGKMKAQDKEKATDAIERLGMTMVKISGVEPDKGHDNCADGSLG